MSSRTIICDSSLSLSIYTILPVNESLIYLLTYLISIYDAFFAVVILFDFGFWVWVLEIGGCECWRLYDYLISFSDCLLF